MFLRGPVIPMPFVSHLFSQGWGESILPGLRGTAWKEKVASIERLNQGVMSGERLLLSGSGSSWPSFPT